MYFSDEAGNEARLSSENTKGREEPSGSGCKFNTDNEDLRSDDHRPAERFLNPDESNPGEKDQCSASVHEYLDTCFPAAQSEPEKTEPEPPHCSKYQSSPTVPPLSVQTQYLTTWTLSQALLLRGRCGIQSATSPEKTLPPQTPPSVSSSTPELFSPVTPSPGASAELFSQPCPTQRAEEGGVIVEATADGVLCSQEAEQQDSTTAQHSPSKSPDLKKARISENQGPTTLLIRCDKRGVRYSVLVAVVHPCHLKEVKVSGDVRMCLPSRSHKFTSYYWNI